jgi:hypothetical protein
MQRAQLVGFLVDTQLTLSRSSTRHHTISLSISLSLGPAGNHAACRAALKEVLQMKNADMVGSFPRMHACWGDATEVRRSLRPLSTGKASQGEVPCLCPVGHGLGMDACC